MICMHIEFEKHWSIRLNSTELWCHAQTASLEVSDWTRGVGRIQVETIRFSLCIYILRQNKLRNKVRARKREASLWTSESEKASAER